MSTLSRVCFSLAVFLAIACAVYGLTSHEPSGTTSLFVAAVTFAFLGYIMHWEAHREAQGAEAAEEVHVGPTIWPLFFSISALILALGLLVSAWILIPGAIVFGVAAGGWLRDVARSRAHAGHP